MEYALIAGCVLIVLFVLVHASAANQRIKDAFYRNDAVRQDAYNRLETNIWKMNDTILSRFDLAKRDELEKYKLTQDNAVEMAKAYARTRTENGGVLPNPTDDSPAAWKQRETVLRRIAEAGSGARIQGAPGAPGAPGDLSDLE